MLGDINEKYMIKGLMEMINLNLDLTPEDATRATQFFASQGKTLEEGVKNIMLFVVSSHGEYDSIDIPNGVPTAEFKANREGVFEFTRDTPIGVRNHIKDLLDDD